MTNTKPNLLLYSDYILAGTGFGTVSRHVVKGLKDHFNMDQLAINYDGQFFDTTEFPIHVSPARLNNPSDPYGSVMFLDAVATGKYDYIWIMNDTFVVERVAKELPKVFEKLLMSKKKVPVIVYYCPVDACVLDTAASMIKLADHVVAYCDYGKAEILKTVPEAASKLHVITHGVDNSAFNIMPEAQRQAARNQFFKVQDKDTFIWMNVNRNSIRKDIARTIFAFKEFKEIHSNSKLYLHTAVRDTTLDLESAVKAAGLTNRDVFFPAGFTVKKAFPIPVLNALYNCSDAFITTTLGEGWGLTHTEAQATGLPFVGPNNTCLPEQFGDGSRGWLYPCRENVWIDNSAFRPLGRVEDIVKTMDECYQDIKSGKAKAKVLESKLYAERLDWSIIGDQWLQLFQNIINNKRQNNVKVGVMV